MGSCSGGSGPTRAVDDLVDALVRSIDTDEAAARDFAQVADTLRRDGHRASANAMLRLCRHHRIRGLEARGNVAALRSGDPPMGRR